jgi:hypothetical protein
MDTAVAPGDDFYKYVNGKWLATFTIPPDKARYGVFDALRDKSEVDVRALVDEIARSKPAAGSVHQKVSDLYNSCMDEATIETRESSSLSGTQLPHEARPMCSPSRCHSQLCTGLLSDNVTCRPTTIRWTAQDLQK